MPPAKADDLVHLGWWRKAIVKQFDFDPPNAETSVKLITVRAPTGLTDDEAEPPNPWDASRPQRKSSGLTSQDRQGSRRGSPPPTSSATDDSSDDDAEAARRSQRERSQVSTIVGTDAHRKIRKEAISLFDPDFKDPKGTGLVVSQNKQIYTDVYLFCEHLRVFERYGEDSLQEYYVSMLGGGA